MARPATWISTVSIGLALAWQGTPAWAQQILPKGTQSPIRLAANDEANSQESAEDSDDSEMEESSPSATTETAETASSDESSANEAGDETVDESVVPAHSIDTTLEGEEAGDGFGLRKRGSTPTEVPISEVIRERYPNGAVRTERKVTQDAQGNYVNHGSWKMWDEKGHAIAQGAYDMGNRAGVWTRWYRTAQEAELLGKAPFSQFSAPFISQATFKHDQLDGLWTIYDGKTHKITQIRFADGKRHGTAIWWFASGRKMREIEYRDGDLDGQFLEWNADGKMTIKDVYQAGHKLSVKVTNHQGQAAAKKSEGMYLFAKEVEQSPDDWWNCKMLVTTKTGPEERHGAWKSWYTNGQIQLEGNYEHDVQVGTFSWWHANGQKAQEGRFDHGKQDGGWTWWHANGQKSISGEYNHGNPTGRWTWWKEDGRVVQSADLSHSDGVAVENMPATPDTSLLPRANSPATAQPPKTATPTLGKPIKR